MALLRSLPKRAVGAGPLVPSLFAHSLRISDSLAACAFHSSVAETPIPPSAPDASASTGDGLPVQIRVRTAEKALHLVYASGRVVSLPTELLRVKSLSSDNTRTDSQGVPRVVGARRHVGIMKVELVGDYGIRLFFDDLHDSGIFSFEYLDHLGRHKLSVSREYLRALRMRGLSRDPPTHQRRTKGA